MAGTVVIYGMGKFQWRYTPPAMPEGNPATELRLKWGTESGAYAHVLAFGVETTGALLKDILPIGSIGQHYAQMAAWNGVKEDPVSPEVPFELRSGGAGGQIDFSVM